MFGLCFVFCLILVCGLVGFLLACLYFNRRIWQLLYQKLPACILRQLFSASVAIELQKLKVFASLTVELISSCVFLKTWIYEGVFLWVILGKSGILNVFLRKWGRRFAVCVCVCLWACENVHIQLGDTVALTFGLVVMLFLLLALPSLLHVHDHI